MRGAAHLSVLLLTSIIAAGCGGDGDSDTPTAAGPSARTATAEAEPAPLRPRTKAGTKLAYGEPAVVAFAPDQLNDGGKFRFEVTVLKPEKGDPSDLDEIVDIGGRIPEGAVPYYVTVHYKLLGDVDPIAEGFAPDDVVFARNQRGKEEQYLTIEFADFKPCNQTSSLPIQPGVDVESCLVFAPPRGVRLKRVSWRPILDEGRERVFWGR